MQEYEQLKQVVAGVQEDMAKAAAGNKAAGTRVRKAMQDVKKLAQAIRGNMLQTRSSDEKPAPAVSAAPAAAKLPPEE